MKKINIFNYLDYRRFLKDLYQWHKKHTPEFSYRYFANKAGIATGFLKNVTG